MTQRDRIVLAVLAVVGVVAGFYLGVLKPTQGELEDLDTQVVAAEQRRDTALADLQSASVARKQYEQDQRTLAVLGKAVPSDDGVPSLVYQLNSVARKAGVDFDSVDVAGASAGASDTPTSAQGLTEMPLTIKFKGSFFELDKFLRGVHRLASIGDEKIDVRGRLMTIEAVALAPSATGLPSLDATVTVKAYVAPPQAAASGGAGATATGTPGTGAAASGTTPAATSSPAASDSTSNTDSASGESSTSSGAN